MDLKNFIGFKFNVVKDILESNGITYTVKEIWDTKNTKLGNDIRVVNIIDDHKVIVYVAYF